MNLVDSNPYGPLKDEEGKPILDKMVEIKCQGCNKVIEEGESFNHCFKCYNLSKGKSNKQDYCLQCNSTKFEGSEVQFVQSSNAFEDDLNVLQEDFMRFLKKGEGKSGRLIFNEQKDQLKPPEQRVKYDPKNPDTRSKFLERCYNSNVRE